MKSLPRIFCVAVAAVGVLGTFATEGFAQRSAVFETRLAGTDLEPFSSGRAKVEFRASSLPGEAQATFFLQVTDLMKTDSVAIFVGGELIAESRVSRAGEVRVYLDSQLGDTIPNVTSGDMVELRNMDGQVVTDGQLRMVRVISGSVKRR